ncbi:mannitol dehydrogenase domain-containing protein [Favolaschia claudopus]|uniref:Mannitol dehydrogenase domain-containing protein n=1 Tax=Favolaschia claudopus TaxID=2862362 RepID=A0AAW0DD21_9AGAR
MRLIFQGWAGDALNSLDSPSDGNIGRGFIAPLLADSGYHVTFTDVDKQLIEAINHTGAYNVHILDSTADPSSSEDGETQVQKISRIQAVLTTTSALTGEIAHPQTKLITTAVGLSVLDKIAPALAAGIQARCEADAGPINVIACENAIGATAKFAENVRACLAEDQDGKDAIEWAEQNVGWANCSVDPIAPPFDSKEGQNNEEKLAVGVEAFYEWVVERERGPLKPSGALEVPVQGMTLVDNLVPYNERKLFTLNTGHAITAYLGRLKGHTTIASSIADPEIRACVSGALLEEFGAALCRRHAECFDEGKHKEYVEKILKRFENAEVKDEVGRVGRAPLRKLGREDRLVGPAKMCVECGVEVRLLARGIAAAMLFEDDGDKESKKMRGHIKDKGVERFVSDVLGFEAGAKGGA